MADVLVLKPKTAAALEALKATGARMFADEIAATNPELFDKGQKSVIAIMTNLHKKGFVEKERVTREVIKNEATVVKQEMQYWVSETGEALEYSISE